MGVDRSYRIAHFHLCKCREGGRSPRLPRGPTSRFSGLALLGPLGDGSPVGFNHPAGRSLRFPGLPSPVNEAGSSQHVSWCGLHGHAQCYILLSVSENTVPKVTLFGLSLDVTLAASLPHGPADRPSLPPPPHLVPGTDVVG